MSKAFVIKNKEGEYLQFFDEDSDDIGFTDDLTLAMLYDKNEKDIMEKAYSNMEWKYTEITLAEGDLEQSIRKQVCDEIRNLTEDYFEFVFCDNCGNTIDNDCYISSSDFNEILEEVEKVEE